MKFSHAILVSCLALGGAIAQQNIVYHPNNAPTGGNAFPFGSEGVRYQSIIPNSLFGPVATITDIFVFGRASSTTTDLCVVYEDIEIRMGLTQVAPSAISSTFATNNPNPTTVYRGPLRVNFVANQWVAIGLPNSYLFLPTSNNDNLCFEVIVWSAKTMPTGSSSNFYFPGASSGARRAFLYRWTINGQPASGLTGSSACTVGFLLDDGNFVANGKGCKSSSNTELQISANTYPQTTKSLTISLTGGEPTTISYLALGLTFAPFEMTPLGAPSCHVWAAPLLSVGTVTDTTGLASITGTIPASSTSGTVFAQWYQLDFTANTAGITTSNFGTVIFGL